MFPSDGRSRRAVKEGVVMKLMQPVFVNTMFRLKTEIAELTKRIKTCNNDTEIKKLKRRLTEKQTHYNILADRLKMRE